MPFLPDIQTSSLSNDANEKIDSVVTQMNESLRLISNEARTDIKKDDSGTERLLIGYQKDGFNNGSVGIKLSQEGIAVSNASADELIFSSDFNLIKIADEATTTITIGSGGGLTQKTVTHNLGVVPAVFAWFESSAFPGQWNPLPTSFYSVSGSTVTYGGDFSFYTTDTSLVFSAAIDSSIAAAVAGTWNIRYTLLTKTLA